MAGLVSTQALGAATDELRTAADALDDTALTALARELAAVADVLRDYAHLRRVLTETTATAEAKASLVNRVVSDKISDESLRLTRQVVAHDWSGGSDLVRGLRRLSRVALFIEAQRIGVLDEVEDQIFRFSRIVDASPELSLILDDPSTPPDGRADLVGRLMAGKAHRLTVELLTMLARSTTGRDFGKGVAEIIREAAEQRDMVVATVTAAVALSTAEVDRLRSALAQIYPRGGVAVHVTVDPTVIGGLRIRVGDEVIDGSIAGRLEAVRDRLAR